MVASAYFRNFLKFMRLKASASMLESVLIYLTKILLLYSKLFLTRILTSFMHWSHFEVILLTILNTAWLLQKTMNRLLVSLSAHVRTPTTRANNSRKVMLGSCSSTNSDPHLPNVQLLLKTAPKPKSLLSEESIKI